mmetsp:Transcript_13227/g.31404  ORF Transcript_13227/g.31404 Transcript_13227/m.31404 type:complete len:204 (-) Transcript_13227:237-848(-)
MGFPLSILHTHTFPSSLPALRYRPSGLKEHFMQALATLHLTPPSRSFCSSGWVVKTRTWLSIASAASSLPAAWTRMQTTATPSSASTSSLFRRETWRDQRSAASAAVLSLTAPTCHCTMAPAPSAEKIWGSRPAVPWSATERELTEDEWSWSWRSSFAFGHQGLHLSSPSRLLSVNSLGQTSGRNSSRSAGWYLGSVSTTSSL